jgi:hypothetical protein
MSGPQGTSGDQKVLASPKLEPQPIISTTKYATSEPFKPIRFINADKSLFLKKEGSDPVGLVGGSQEVAPAKTTHNDSQDFYSVKGEPRVRGVSRSPIRTFQSTSNPQNFVSHRMDNKQVMFVDRVVTSEKGTLGETRGLYATSGTTGRSTESPSGYPFGLYVQPPARQVVSGNLELVRNPIGQNLAPDALFGKPKEQILRSDILKGNPAPSNPQGPTSKHPELVLDRYENGKPIYRFK